ncbi:hypothetical protein [Streptomyces cyanogenus]|uniref:Secreted protein n=1 Tax=Streptomyces cyanogenus TaxID=80860 RepID=A0ABX7TJZ1_STRCY|nr:hypothetical protein [Streptomyces cyanogenus]QTD96984.1 hypothetical protein S1361_06445 [Streptomyces cyanogenus]
MRTTVTAALAGAIGIVIGAAGWAVIGPEKTRTVDARPSAAATASPTLADGSRHYSSAQQIADALQTHGMTVSMLHKSSEDTYISEVGGSSYDFTVSDKAGQPAPGDAGINMFPNREALTSWVELSKSMGGIAVTGDTWAVSLPTTSTAARTDSKRLAPLVAKALDGTVQQ